MKKVVLFVVEGSTDETALALLLDKVFSSAVVKFDIVGGDITSCQSSSSPRDLVRSRVKDHLLRQEYDWGDLACVIQLVDTDGAFVAPQHVKPSADGVLSYGFEAIEAPDVDAIVERNRKKSSSLRQLSMTGCLRYRKAEVPYFVYFMSRNLEHALHNKPESLSADEKERLARRFQRRYSKNVEGFVSFLEDEIAVAGDYLETWRYIEEGTNSLKRCSNLHLVFRNEAVPR